MKKYIELIRVKHWLKNFLVFLPVFFSINILNKNYLLKCSLAFIIFCLISSSIYIINDINDIEKDRNHPIKKNRPLAAGKISKRVAYIIMIIFLILASLITAYIYQDNHNIFVIVIPISYVVLNILYSKGLKNIAVIDVLILVSGFVFRTMYGGVVVNVDVSKYLYLMIVFGGFYLGFGKRRNEIIKTNGNATRKVLKVYNKDFLDKNMYVAYALAIVSYTMWCVDKETIAHVGNDYLFWTIPLLMVILQLYSLEIEGNSYGDPVEVILSDKKLLITVVIYAIIMGGLLYLI